MGIPFHMLVGLYILLINFFFRKSAEENAMFFYFLDDVGFILSENCIAIGKAAKDPVYWMFLYTSFLATDVMLGYQRIIRHL